MRPRSLPRRVAVAALGDALHLALCLPGAWAVGIVAMPVAAVGVVWLAGRVRT